MGHLTSSEIEKLLCGIRAVYALQNPDTFDRDSLVILNRLLSTEIAVIIDGEKNRFSEPHHLPSGHSLTAKGRLLLDLIQPHLSQALQTTNQLKLQQQEIVRLRKSIDTVGIIFLDRTGKLDWMTSQAHRLLQQYLPSSIDTYDRELPSKLQSWVNHQITNSANCHPMRSSFLPLFIKQAQTELTIRLTGDILTTSSILLLYEEPIQSLNASLELLGLSTREAEVLTQIIQGQTPKEIAKNLEVSVATARKHLENIYRKLEVQSQTEAVTTALARLGIFSPLPFH